MTHSVGETPYDAEWPAATRKQRRRATRMHVPGSLPPLAGSVLMLAGQGWPGVCALNAGAA